MGLYLFYLYTHSQLPFWVVVEMGKGVGCKVACPLWRINSIPPLQNKEVRYSCLHFLVACPHPLLTFLSLCTYTVMTVVSRRGKSHRHWAEGFSGWQDGTQSNVSPFPSPLHSSSHQMRNAGPSPRKLTALPCLCLSCHFPALEDGTEDSVVLITGGTHPFPINRQAFAAQGSVQPWSGSHCSSLLSCWSRRWPTHSALTGKVLLSLYFPPFPYSCFPCRKEVPKTHLYQFSRAAIFQSIKNWVA